VEKHDIYSVDNTLHATHNFNRQLSGALLPERNVTSTLSVSFHAILDYA